MRLKKGRESVLGKTDSTLQEEQEKKMQGRSELVFSLPTILFHSAAGKTDRHVPTFQEDQEISCQVAKVKQSRIWRAEGRFFLALCFVFPVCVCCLSQWESEKKNLSSRPFTSARLSYINDFKRD